MPWGRSEVETSANRDGRMTTDRVEAIRTFMAGFGPLLVLIASFRTEKAYWKLEGIDYLFGFSPRLPWYFGR